MSTNPFQNQSSTPSSIVGVFVPKAQTKDVLGEVKKEVESGYVTTKEGVQPVRTIVETQRGYTRNIVSRTATPTSTKQTVENVVSNINREAGGQQLVTYSPVAGGFKVSQNPNTVFNPNLNRELSSNLIKAGLVGRSQDRGSVVFKPQVETGAVKVVTEKQDLSNVMSRVQNQPEQSYTAKVIYGEAGREVGSQAVNLYESINPKDIKLTSTRYLYQQQKPYIEGEKIVQKLETSPGILENIAGGFGRMYLGASELFVNAPQTVGASIGAEFERRAGVKPGIEDVKVIGTGLGLAAAGAAGTEQVGQNIALFDVAGPAGIVRGAKIGAAIGLGTSTVAESSNVIEGKKADVGKIAIQTGLGGVGGAIGGAIETGIPKVTSAIGKTKIAQDIGKGIAEVRIKGADINVNTQQFVTPLTETEGYNIGRGTFTSKKLGISGTIDSSSSISALSPTESVGEGISNIRYSVKGKQVSQKSPFEFRQQISPTEKGFDIKGAYDVAGTQGRYEASGIRSESKDIIATVGKTGRVTDVIRSSGESILDVPSAKTYGRLTDVFDVFGRNVNVEDSKISKDITEGLLNIKGSTNELVVPPSKVKVGQSGNIADTVFIVKEPPSISDVYVTPKAPEVIRPTKPVSKEPNLPSSILDDVIQVKTTEPTNIKPVDRPSVSEVRGRRSVTVQKQKPLVVEDTYGDVYRYVYPSGGISEQSVRSSLRSSYKLFEPSLNIPRIPSLGIGLVSGIKLRAEQIQLSPPKQSLGVLQSIGQPTISVITPTSSKTVYPTDIPTPKIVEPTVTTTRNIYRDSFIGPQKPPSYSVNINPSVSPFSISSPSFGLPNLGGGGGGSEGARGQKVSTRANVLDLLSITRLKR